MSDTSAAAYALVKPSSANMREEIFGLLEKSMSAVPRGMTCDAVEVVTGWKHQTVSARIRELVVEGRIKDSGVREPTRSDSPARVYVVVS